VTFLRLNLAVMPALSKRKLSAEAEGVRTESVYRHRLWAHQAGQG